MASPSPARMARLDVAFSPDGKLLATASRDTTAVGGGVREPAWQVPHRPQGRRVWTWRSARTASCSPPPAGTRPLSCGMWSPGTRSGKPLTGHEEPVNGVAFSPDGTLLATVSTDETVRLWNVASGKQHGQPLTGHTNAVQDVAFSPDGRLLATVSTDETVRLWDVASGKQHGQPLTGHTNAVQDVAFSPDGKLIASAGEDGTARLWEVDNGRRFGPPLTGHTGVGPQPYGPLWGVAFSPDGKLLATAGGDGTARLWNPWFTSWEEYGCALVNRNLSMTEWNQSCSGSAVRANLCGSALWRRCSSRCPGRSLLNPYPLVWMEPACRTATGAALTRMFGARPAFADTVDVVIMPRFRWWRVGRRRRWGLR